MALTLTVFSDFIITLYSVTMPHLHQYKTTVVRKYYNKDHEAGGNFVHWYLHAVHSGATDPTVILFAIKLASRSMDILFLRITGVSLQTFL